MYKGSLTMRRLYTSPARFKQPKPSPFQPRQRGSSSLVECGAWVPPSDISEKCSLWVIGLGDLWRQMSHQRLEIYWSTDLGKAPGPEWMGKDGKLQRLCPDRDQRAPQPNHLADWNWDVTTGVAGFVPIRTRP